MCQAPTSAAFCWQPKAREKPTARPSSRCSAPVRSSGNGDNVGIVDCFFINPYQAVDFGTNPCGRHYIRNLYGQPLYRGIWVDFCLDVGRLENVHFWPFWSQNQRLYDWMRENGVAFSFGRTDWQYVTNCFSIIYKIGFHLADFGKGPGNVLFVNSGSDVSVITAQIDATQEWAGATFVNAQMNGALQINQGNEGPIKFTNSSFYGSGTTESSVTTSSTGRVSFDNCHFTGWDQTGTGAPALHVKSGIVGLSNCEFFSGKSHIVLEKGVRTATIMGSHFRGATRIENKSKGKVHLIGNTDTAPGPMKTLKRVFYNGFEAGEVQPILNRPEIMGHAGASSVSVKSGGRSGNALFIEGVKTDLDKGPASYYFRVFDGLKIPVTENTVLRYWLRSGTASARSAGLELIFSDGTPLRATGAKDENDQPLHAAYNRGETGKWIRVESAIGRWAAGKTIVAIQVARDGIGNDAFSAAIDDIEIGEAL